MICLDSDEAGAKGSVKTADMLLKQGVDKIAICWLPEKDMYDTIYKNRYKDIIKHTYSESDRGKLVVGGLMKYDTEELYKLSQQAVDKNISEGYPHLNFIGYCSQLYGEEGILLNELKENLLKNSVDGKLKSEDIKNLLRQWIKICKLVRSEHE